MILSSTPKCGPIFFVSSKTTTKRPSRRQIKTKLVRKTHQDDHPDASEAPQRLPFVRTWVEVRDQTIDCTLWPLCDLFFEPFHFERKLNGDSRHFFKPVEHA